MAAEVFIVLFVFAGVIKAVPQVADAFSWDLTMILGAMAAFLFCLQLLMRGGMVWRGTVSSDFWLVALAVTLFAGTFYSTAPDSIALSKAFRFAVLGVLGSYAFPQLAAGLSKPLTVARNCLLVILSVAGALAFILFLCEPGLGFLRTPGGSYLSWGYMVGAAIIAACTFLALSKSKLRSVFICVLILLLLGALIYARGRGPVIALAGVLAVAGIAYRWIPLRRRMGVAAVAIAIAVGFLVLMPASLRYRYERVLSSDVGSSIESRVDAYKVAWSMFVQSPLIGEGTGSYITYHGRFEYPHNIVLEAMAEYGSLGLVLLAGFVTSVWLKLVWAVRETNGRERALIAGAGLVFVYMLIGSMFSGDLTSRTLWFSAGLVALCTRRRHVAQSANTAGRGA